MKSVSHKSFAFCFGLIGLCVLVVGCVRLTTGTVRHPLSPAFAGMRALKIGVTSRSDVTNRFGPMHAYFDDLHVGYYYLDDVTRRGLWLALGVIPVGTSSFDAREALFLRFDQNERIEQIDVIDRMSLWDSDCEYHAKTWSTKSK